MSRQVIEERMGLSYRLFAYPNGQVGDFDYRTRKLLIESGCEGGFTTVEGMNDRESGVKQRMSGILGRTRE